MGVRLGGAGRRFLGVSILVAGLVPAGHARADGWFDFLDFKGSFGEAGGFHRYVPAISNPLFNETPYITTEVRPLYLHDEIPTSFVTKGGSIDAGAVEARLALTDRLGFIAPKDGYAQAHFNSALNDTSGFENIAAGFKYAMVSDPGNDTIVTVGSLYEPPTGTLRTSGLRLQGHSGGFVNLFVAGAKGWGPLGFEANVGPNIAVDSHHDSSILHYAAHVDYQATERLFPVIEVNGFSVVAHGQRTPINFEGVDLLNFGSTMSGTVVTAAFGARYEINEHLQVGGAYELPITHREDILGSRFYADLILRY